MKPRFAWHGPRAQARAQRSRSPRTSTTLSGALAQVAEAGSPHCPEHPVLRCQQAASPYCGSLTRTLVPDLTFETLAFGSHTRFAHAAAVAVAESPGQAYNPLLIHGGLRPWRTHVLHALGNLAHQLYPSLNICYILAAEFGGEFSAASGNGQQDTFRSSYADIDLLLVDSTT